MEFYLDFLDDLKDILLHMINVAWNKNFMPNSWKHGIVKLIPKKNLCEHLFDWRPITLMLVIYKLITKMLVHRLHNTLHNELHPL